MLFYICVCLCMSVLYVLVCLNVVCSLISVLHISSVSFFFFFSFCFPFCLPSFSNCLDRISKVTQSVRTHVPVPMPKHVTDPDCVPRLDSRRETFDLSFLVQLDVTKDTVTPFCRIWRRGHSFEIGYMWTKRGLTCTTFGLGLVVNANVLVTWHFLLLRKVCLESHF